MSISNIHLLPKEEQERLRRKMNKQEPLKEKPKEDKKNDRKGN